MRWGSENPTASIHTREWTMKLRNNRRNSEQTQVIGRFATKNRTPRLTEDEIVANILERTGPGSLMYDLEYTELASRKTQRIRLR